MMLSRNKESGFTLGELIGALVVVAVIGGVVSILAHFVAKYW